MCRYPQLERLGHILRHLGMRVMDHLVVITDGGAAFLKQHPRSEAKWQEIAGSTNRAEALYRKLTDPKTGKHF